MHSSIVRQDSGGEIEIGIALENLMPIVSITTSSSPQDDVLLTIACSDQNSTIYLSNTGAIGSVPEQAPYWFEPQPPPLLPAPQFVNDTTNNASYMQVLAPTEVLNAMLSNWIFRTLVPGSHTVQLMLDYSTNAITHETLSIPLVAKPTLSSTAPRVAFVNPDEGPEYETPLFSWAGSFSHLMQGQEQQLPPEWVVPPCYAVQSNAAWTVCPSFFAPGSPVLYAQVFPQDPAAAAVARTLAAVADPSACSGSGRLHAVVSVQNANASRGNFPGAPWAAIPPGAPDTFPGTWFECRAGPAECGGASPVLRLGSVANLTFWPEPAHAHPASNGTGYRMSFTGWAADVQAALGVTGRGPWQAAGRRPRRGHQQIRY